MERESLTDENEVERETDTGDDDTDDANIEARERAMAVYGDTDMNPIDDQQRDAHHADAGEHV